ncbi:helix-turn-helix transcriptional regulator [Mycobacterium sp. pW045]|uniref:helix-turn-helix transcriptional regulator n=1 Tax=Mycobacterium sp. pW045 TaxID=3238984 RepID=UPI00351B1001
MEGKHTGPDEFFNSVRIAVENLNIDRDRLYTSAELAPLIKLADRQTLDGWRHQNIGPPYRRVGPRRVVYLGSDVLKWLDGSLVVPGGAR